MDDFQHVHHRICYSLCLEVKKRQSALKYLNLAIQEASIIHLPSAKRQLVGTERLGNLPGIAFAPCMLLLLAG